MMRILIGADVVPTKNNIDFFKEGTATQLVGKELLDVLRAADCRFINLEVPLTDASHPIHKCGPNLIAPPEAITGYRALGINFVSLANNHIMDQGADGLYSTIQTLHGAGIAYAGAGATTQEAAKPHTITLGNKAIGVYCCAEHEFSIASECHAGANPFDPLESPDHISSLKNTCDYVIVLYHGGKEFYRYPSPDLQKTCRKLIEKGADLVVCQHSHCIGCEEKYNDGTIVYGQGDFLFDHTESEFGKTGLLVSLEISNDTYDICYIPLMKDCSTVRLADKETGEQILRDFYQRSEYIKKDGVIAREYEAFAKTMLTNYLNSFHGRHFNSVIMKALNKMSGGKLRKALMSHYYRRKNLLQIENYLYCEAHRELIIAGLRDKQA